MKPIGLAFKKGGELMVVHECLKCGKISFNRIAGDDNTSALLELLGVSAVPVNIKGDRLLTKEDSQQVQIALFGWM